MTLGLENCCTCEVYTIRDGERVPLPACTASVQQNACPPSTANVEFSVDDEFWLNDGFDFSCEFIYIDRVCIENGQEVRQLVFKGAMDSPAPIGYNDSGFAVTLVDEYGIKGSCPIDRDYVGDFVGAQLLVDIAEAAGFTAKSTYDLPPEYPILPATPIVITAATHPGGPMTEPTFAALVNWCNIVGAFHDAGGTPVNTETFLYADEPGPGGSAPGNPGPWDEFNIENFPYPDGQTRTVVFERYIVNPDGTLCRETSIDRAGDGAPPFQPAHFNRCVTCEPPGNITRDIRRSACLDTASQLKSIANEIGATIIYDMETCEICFSNDPGNDLPELRLSTLENLCDARLFPASGGYTEICVTGTDNAFTNIAIPSECRKKVKTGRVEVGQDGINDAGLAILLACADPEPACEVIIDPTCTELPLVGGGYSPDVPVLHQRASVEIQAQAANGLPCPHPANSSTTDKPISRRRLEWDDNGDEVITLTIGNVPPPTAQELLDELLQRL